MTPEMRVRFDEVEFDGEMPVLCGRPFTGIVFDVFADGGVSSEESFVEGQREGPSRVWRETGILVEEVYYWHGMHHGVARVWGEEGRVRRERMYEFGFLIAERQWDDCGVLIKDWFLDEGDWRFDVIDEKRKALRAPSS